MKSRPSLSGFASPLEHVRLRSEFTTWQRRGFSGPSAMGVLFDLTGGFTLGLFALAAVLLAMAIACLGLERPLGFR